MTRLCELSDAADPGPWAYRPDKFDDWGMIRGGEVQDSIIGPLRPPVARSNATWAELNNFGAHREAGTDPMEPNGRFIVELVNAYREGRIIEVETNT